MVRPATAGDLPGARAVAEAHGDVFEPDRPDNLTHELEQGRLVVAADASGVVGFGGALERGGVTYLADLFLLPDRLGLGIGSAIMGELFPRARTPRFTFASGDPRALPLYVRFGMRPLTPLLYLRGDPATFGRLPHLDATLQEAEPGGIVALDGWAFGRERRQDLAFMQAAGWTGLVARRGRGVVGYGFLRVAPRRDGPRALINPSGADSEENLAAVTFALLRRAAPLAPVVNIAVLGTHPALPALLAAGFRVEDRDTSMASDPRLIDGTRYGPSPVIG